MSILARITAHGGEVIRQNWRFTLQRGRLSTEAIAWLRPHWRAVCLEAWPILDQWEERAAIMEFDGGLSRAQAENEAYRQVMPC